MDTFLLGHGVQTIVLNSSNTFSQQKNYNNKNNRTQPMTYFFFSLALFAANIKLLICYPCLPVPTFTTLPIEGHQLHRSGLITVFSLR